VNREQARNSRLPTKRNLTPIAILSLLIALLVGVASAAGLLFRSDLYPAEDLLQSFVPTDVVNLFIGLPMLLGSIWLAWRGKLVGLLLWPGALFSLLYTYVVYVFAMPLSGAFLLHLALVALSLYTIIALMASIDGGAVRQRLAGAVLERLAGGVLAVLGLLFFLRALATMAGAVAGQTPMVETDLALNATDFLISPAPVIGGVLLWRRREFGYVAGLGLLFQASMLFVGLIVLLVLQPFLIPTDFRLIDVVVVFVLGLICFVPFALFVRGILSGRGPSPAP
jgi:hypothetical protein